MIRSQIHHLYCHKIPTESQTLNFLLYINYIKNFLFFTRTYSRRKKKTKFEHPVESSDIYL